jgi:succinyl-diaminopimelate desuccinylase
MENMQDIFDFIVSSKDEMVKLQTLLTTKQALDPESGGQGELEKCLALESWLKENNFTDVKRYDAPDSRVESGIRPNLLVTIPGKDTSKSLWLMTHMDVVPVGELSMWNSDPWQVIEKDGKLFGRGVEDNQQGLVSSIFAVLSLIKNNVTPKYNVKLLFVADEEVGSNYGIQYLLENYSLFSKDDMVIIPDGGDSLGKTIEIAEKNLMWIQFHIQGKQAHGSRPDEGANACLAGYDLALRVNNLEKVFDKRDELFEPPYSTFQPTKKESNVPNINTIPGDDVFCMDCRILPCYKLDFVKSEIDKIVKEIETQYSVKVNYECPQAVESPATSKDSDVVKLLSNAIKQVKGIDSKLIGIGGGTVGSFLRNEGYQCTVWGTLDETAHQPNEYCIINNMIEDAKVLAVTML